MLWRFYVYLASASASPPPRREVLFKLNGAKLSEPGAHRSGGEVPRGGMQIIIAGR